jgi:hypothetical protein
MSKLDKYIQKMEDKLEGDNYHSMIGIHRRIANVLLLWVSERVALKILQTIGSLI